MKVNHKCQIASKLHPNRKYSLLNKLRNSTIGGQKATGVNRTGSV